MKQSDYLIHYGVLGMKWGVRKSDRMANRYKQRAKDYSDRKNAASKNRAKAAQYQKELNDLKKNGYKSKYWKQRKDYSEYGSEVHGSKKAAKDALISDYQRMIKDRKTEAYNWNKLADSIKSTPINKKTYLDVVRKRNKIRNGVQIAGTALGMSGSLALGIVTKSPNVFLGSAVASGLLGGYITSKIGTTERAQYNKRNKKNKLSKVESRQFYLS